MKGNGGNPHVFEESQVHSAFYHNAAWQYGMQAVKYVLPLITLPYLTRVLGAESYAVYAYVVSFMNFVQVLIDFGFNLSGTKRIAADHDPQACSLVVGRITQARLLLCGLVAVGAALVGSFIPIMRQHPLYAAIAFVAICGKALAPDFLFQGMERMGPLTTRYLASKGTSTVLTFVFVHSVADMLLIPVLDVISSAIALVWSLAAAKRLFGVGVAWVPWREALGALRESGYYCLSNMASTAFSGFTTLLIGMAITDAEQISYWSMAMTAVTAVQALYAPITNSLYPHMVVGRDFSFARRLLLVSLPFVTVGTVAFFLLSDIIVLLIGGSGYMDGAYVLRLVAPVLWFSFYGMMLGWPVLGALGQVKELTRTTVISCLASVAVLLAITATGFASLTAFAVVRDSTEALMCGLRAVECWRFFRRRRHNAV